MDGRNNQRRIKKTITLILAATLMITMCFGSFETAEAKEKDKVSDVLKCTGDYIYSKVKEPCYGAIGGEWAVYGLKEAGYPVSDNYYKTYKKSVEKAVKEGYRGKPGTLHDKKYTDYSRVVFAYGKLDFDPTNVAGYDLLEKLADYDKVKWQGINGPIWALRALDSGGYDMPDAPKGAVQATRNMYIDFILDAQLPDGGWDIVSKNADPDMTAMALQALAPYRNKAKVKKATDKALEVLSEIQNANGGYSSGGAANSESCSQVIWALTLLGIDADTDTRFIKGGKSVVDALLTFYDKKTGGFRHVNTAQGGYEATVNQMATEQAYYALASYKYDVAKARITKLSAPSKSSLKVTWEKQSTADGYEVTITTNKNFKKNVNKSAVSKNSTVTKTFKSLKSGNTYYARVRAYRNIDGHKVYGDYSAVKKLKI